MDQLARKLSKSENLTLGEARSEASLLAQKALNLTPLKVLTLGNTPLETFSNHICLRAWVEERLEGKPLSRILGKRAFWEHIFLVNEHTLDPRPETEGLLEAMLRLYPEKTNSLRVVELGVGTGCVLCSVLHLYPKAHGWGTDVSMKALEVAKENARHVGIDKRITFLQGNWCAPLEETLKGKIDVVVSNPPYIESLVIETLARGVRNYDPHLALDGGADGLEAYRILVPQAHTFLKKDGALILEIGSTQRQVVTDLVAPFFSKIDVQKDFSGHDRILICRSPHKGYGGPLIK